MKFLKDSAQDRAIGNPKPEIGPRRNSAKLNLIQMNFFSETEDRKSGGEWVAIMKNYKTNPSLKIRFADEHSGLLRFRVRTAEKTNPFCPFESADLSHKAVENAGSGRIEPITSQFRRRTQTRVWVVSIGKRMTTYDIIHASEE